MLSLSPIASLADMQAFAGFCKQVTAIPLPRFALLSVMEAAAHLGVSRPTIYTYCERGTLQFTRVRGAIRIAGADLDLLRASRSPGTSSGIGGGPAGD
jgi:excisionase family DNA binding protein